MNAHVLDPCWFVIPSSTAAGICGLVWHLARTGRLAADGASREDETSRTNQHRRYARGALLVGGWNAAAATGLLLVGVLPVGFFWVAWAFAAIGFAGMWEVIWRAPVCSPARGRLYRLAVRLACWLAIGALYAGVGYIELLWQAR